MLETIHGNSQDENNDSEVEPKHSKRARIEKSFGPNFLMDVLEGEPYTFQEAMNSLKSFLWKEVI